MLACLPGQGMALLARPRTVIVLVLFEPLVFVNTEQDERLLGPRIYDARRRCFGMFEGLHLVFGEFDHGCLPYCPAKKGQWAGDIALVAPAHCDRPVMLTIPRSLQQGT